MHSIAADVIVHTLFEQVNAESSIIITKFENRIVS